MECVVDEIKIQHTTDEYDYFLDTSNRLGISNNPFTVVKSEPEDSDGDNTMAMTQCTVASLDFSKILSTNTCILEERGSDRTRRKTGNSDDTNKYVSLKTSPQDLSKNLDMYILGN